MVVPIQTALALVVFGLVGSFQLGYHASVYSQPQAVMEAFVAESYAHQFGEQAPEDYVTITWAIIVGCYGIGALISDFFVQYIMDRFGRKGAMYIAVVINIIGSSLQALAFVFNLYQLLIAGRILTGIGTSAAANTHMVFMSEIAPTNIRGTAGASIHVVAVFSTIIANLLGFPSALGTKDRWAYLFLVPITILLIFLVVSLKFPESPKSLVANKNRPDLALESLAFYNDPETDLQEILRTIYDESCGVNFQTSKWRIVNFLNFLKANKCFRKPAFLLICISLSISFCGYYLMLTFAVYILIEAGLSDLTAHYAGLSYCFVNLFAAVLHLWLIEHKGRRPLTLFGAWTTFSCLAVLFLCETLRESSFTVSKTILTVLSIAAVLTHASGKASLVCGNDALKGELFPSFIRAAMVIYSGGIWINVSNIFLSLVYLPLQRKIGSLALLILLVIPMFVLACILTKLCPETKGKHVSHIVQEIMDLETEKNSLLDEPENLKK